MSTPYRLIFRGIRGGIYYLVDKNTGKRTSLQTANARHFVAIKEKAFDLIHDI